MLRGAGPADLPAVRDLHRRCSPQSLGRRYQQGPAGEADRYLGHLLDPRHGHSVVAETVGGEVVGLGHLLRDGAEAEVALLVADAWQRHGIGSAMLRWLLDVAAVERYETVYAVTQTSNDGMAAVMRGTGLPLAVEVAGGTLVLALRPHTLPVGPPALPVPATG